MIAAEGNLYDPLDRPRVTAPVGPGAIRPGLSAMFEAVEEGYADEIPARVHSGFLIRVPLDTRKTSIWTGRGSAVEHGYGSERPLGNRTGAMRYLWA